MLEAKNDSVFAGGLESIRAHKDFNERAGSTELFELKKNPELIVRAEAMDSKDTESLKTAKTLFTEVEEFGVAVPKINYILANDEEGQKKVFTVTDRIHGEPLDVLMRNETSLDEFEKKRIESLFESLVNYFKSKYVIGAKRIDDLGKMDQYVYGIRKGETNKRTYLVDVSPNVSEYYDPSLSTNPVSKEFLHNSQFFIDLARLAASMRDFHTQKFLELKKPKSELLNFINNIRPQDLINHKILIKEIEQALK